VLGIDGAVLDQRQPDAARPGRVDLAYERLHQRLRVTPGCQGRAPPTCQEAEPDHRSTASERPAWPGPIGSVFACLFLAGIFPVVWHCWCPRPAKRGVEPSGWRGSLQILVYRITNAPRKLPLSLLSSDLCQLSLPASAKSTGSGIAGDLLVARPYGSGSVGPRPRADCDPGTRRHPVSSAARAAFILTLFFDERGWTIQSHSTKWGARSASKKGGHPIQVRLKRR
jgi:hypothetical protein